MACLSLGINFLLYQLRDSLFALPSLCGSLLTYCLKTNDREQKFVLVDTETLHEKDFDIQQPSSVATFMESLALLDGANMVSY